MTIRQHTLVFTLSVLLIFSCVTVAVVRAAAAPCRNETICSQYGMWEWQYWWYSCDKEPCPQEPM